jgi:hypothetical protein
LAALRAQEAPVALDTASDWLLTPVTVFVRFFGRFTTATDIGGAPFWCRLTYRYVEALHHRGIPMRLMSLAPVDMRRGSIWQAFSDLFTTPMQTPYVNVVCDNAQAAQHLWTADVLNVALAAVEYRGQLLPWAAYEKYDLVIVPRESQKEALLETGCIPTALKVIDPLDHSGVHAALLDLVLSRLPPVPPPQGGFVP